MAHSRYLQHPETGVFHPVGAARMATYVDGAEGRLTKLFSEVRDLGSDSDELVRQAIQWPLSYHVSPYRPVLLDCLGLPGRADTVLEIGAGCGAITRWLGERFERVLAVEGSGARAEVARLRCRGQKNVEVYADNLFTLPFEGEADVATLIGVLEYSGLFHPTGPKPPEQAAVEALKVAHRALRASGLLVIAIENRLGVGYLLGAPEDHTSVRFEGVEGYPRSGTAVTWSRRALEQLIFSAGFTASDLLIPLPNYKEVRAVVRPEDAKLLINGFADAGGWEPGTRPHVCSPLARREVARAGLAGELADSFLILAFKGPKEEVVESLGLDLDWVARHYALGRRKLFRKRLTIRPDRLAGLRLEPVRWDDGADLDDRLASAEAVFGLAHRLVSEPYCHGELLIFEVLRTVAVRGIGPEFLDHVREFRGWLLEEYGDGAGAGGLEMVCGSALDAVWWNVVVDSDGHWNSIDHEWVFARPLPVEFVVWRMLRHFAGRYRAALPPFARSSTAAFATATSSRAFPSARIDLAVCFERLETAVAEAVEQVEVPGNPLLALQVLEAAAVAPPGPLPVATAANCAYIAMAAERRARQVLGAALRRQRAMLRSR